MPKLKYTGTAESIQVFGFGHFKPGDEKEVDAHTAAIFSDQRCVDEGFTVTLDGEGGNIAATGARAGTPGTWEPAGAAPVAALSAMSAILAMPLTPWTTGQHMALGDATEATWDGSAWVAGQAAIRNKKE